MIQIIAGKKGSGKTKRIIDMTNEKVKDSQHDVVFIDDDNRYMLDIDHKARFINASEYKILTPEMFLGFLCGMLSQNFDVGRDLHRRVQEAGQDRSEQLRVVLRAFGGAVPEAQRGLCPLRERGSRESA